MKINDFALKYKLNSRHTKVVVDLFKDEEKSEEDWVKQLKGAVVLTIPSELPRKKVQEKIVKAKEKLDKTADNKIKKVEENNKK